MSEEKPAELRLRKDEVELMAVGAKGRDKKRPSLLSVLHVVLIGIGYFGRVLKLIDKIYEWWNNSN